MIEIFLACLSGLLFVLLLTCFYFLVKCARVLINITDEIAECLDIIDKSYTKIGEILKTPVLMDDPFVRSVISEISHAQHALLVVANKLTTGWNKKEDDDEIEEDDEETEEDDE